jgi:hypothetical protein
LWPPLFPLLISKLLAVFNISQTESGNWIEHTKDRPFNDRRHAVDSTKLRQLGWKQKTTFEEGLKITADWYRDFPSWLGDITNVLTPFPVIMGQSAAPGDPRTREESQVLKTTGANALRSRYEEKKGWYGNVGPDRHGNVLIVAVYCCFFRDRFNFSLCQLAWHKRMASAQSTTNCPCLSIDVTCLITAQK